MDYAQKIAKALLRINAVVFCVEEPVTFTSGIRAPVYVDNRKFPFWPKDWHLLLEAFSQKIKEENLMFDVMAGIETAGIPHSSALAYLLFKPSVFVRKKPKEHGLKSKIEGGDVAGKHVLLIEDLVTTGGSSLAGVEALRQARAKVTDCLVIVNYGFPESQNAFQKAKIKLHTLTSFPVILQEAIKAGKINTKGKDIIEQWLQNPYEWSY